MLDTVREWISSIGPLGWVLGGLGSLLVAFKTPKIAWRMDLQARVKKLERGHKVHREYIEQVREQDHTHYADLASKMGDLSAELAETAALINQMQSRVKALERLTREIAASQAQLPAEIQ